MLNEAAADILRFDNPGQAVGADIYWQKNRFHVAGVFKNYNHLFLKESFEPLILTQSQPHEGYITVSFRPGTLLEDNERLALLKKASVTAIPGAPFDFLYLQDHYANQYGDMQQEHRVMNGFSILALLICMIGLFSLSRYSIQKRFKEIAVRKVFRCGYAKCPANAFS